MHVNNNRNDSYVYIYLDNRKPGKWEYQEKIFDFQPLYVGIGVGSRMNQHLTPSSLRQINIKNKIFKKIIYELKEEPIHFKLYENLIRSQAIEIEIGIVKRFGRIDLGTGILSNMDDGGWGGSGIKMSEETKNKIGDRLRGSNSPTSIAVAQFDENKNEIMVWPSIREAVRQTGINDRAISRSCETGKPSLDGSFWEKRETLYVNPPPKPTYKHFTNAKEVFQYLDGEFINKFPSATNAAKTVGTSIPSISLAATQQRIHKGFKWSYMSLG